MGRFLIAWGIFLLPLLLGMGRDLSPGMLIGSGCAGLLMALLADAVGAGGAPAGDGIGWKRLLRFLFLFSCAGGLLFWETAYAVSSRIARQPLTADMLMCFDLKVAAKLYLGSMAA